MTTTMHLSPHPRADANTFRLRSRRRGAVLCSLSATGQRALGWFVMSLVLGLAAAHARAQDVSSLPLLAPDALNGGRYVASALGTDRPSLRLAGTLGYGFTESVLARADHHHRLAGELAVALVVAPWFQAAVTGELRLDKHTPDGPGSDTGVLGSSRILTRHVLAVGRRVAIGFSPKMLFLGDGGFARGFKSASYELSALFSARLAFDLELSLNAGYRFDRTRYAVANAQNLAEPQRLAAGLSDEDAYLFGALLSVPLQQFRLAAEWSWELQRPGHVHALESPMRVRAALQRVFAERFLPSIEIGVDTSTRPTLLGLTRIEPRVWARIGLAVLLERRPALRAQAAKVAPPVTPPLPPATVLRAVSLHIVDTHGQPVVAARIGVPREEGQDEYTTDAEGNVTLQVPPGVTAVTIEAEGYEPLWRTLGGEPKPETAVVLKAGLPPAEIKGIVRNLAGDPLRATVTVLPQALTVSTDARGQFAIGVAPGDYTLRIMADGYEPQERRAQVELRDVTIIVVDLRKAAQ